MTGVLIRRGHTDTHEEIMPREDRGRDWRDAATSQGTAGTPRAWTKPRKIIPQNLWGELGPAGPLISDFWPPELGENEGPLF